MSRGFLMFAHNSEKVDYGLIALVNARMIKANLKENNVTLVTDQGTIDYLNATHTEEVINKAFDHVVVRSWADAHEGTSERRFHDTLSTTHTVPWHNGGRRSAYALSPYDETVLIDCDYLVMDSTLDLVWGSNDDIMINREARTLAHQLPNIDERFLDPFTIPMYWATCVYFRKSEAAALLFDLVSAVREDYEFYQLVYGFKGRLYRNDYAFSIAIHMMNGFIERDGIPPLPTPVLFSSFDCDELYEVCGKNELLFYVNDTSDRWMFRLTKVKNINIHCMNKFSIIRHAAKFLEVYS
jgi:hypothetical protein